MEALRLEEERRRAEIRAEGTAFGEGLIGSGFDRMLQ